MLWSDMLVVTCRCILSAPVNTSCLSWTKCVHLLQTWCSILAAVPRSRLVLKNKPFACAETRAMWLKRFTSRDVASWRIDLLPLTAQTGDHMQQYSMMDISLDPWPYTGKRLVTIACSTPRTWLCSNWSTHKWLRLVLCGRVCST
jgi:hypothetical protein